jgi:hypothetical protein
MLKYIDIQTRSLRLLCSISASILIYSKASDFTDTSRDKAINTHSFPLYLFKYKPLVILGIVKARRPRWVVLVARRGIETLCTEI